MLATLGTELKKVSRSTGTESKKEEDKMKGKRGHRTDTITGHKNLETLLYSKRYLRVFRQRDLHKVKGDPTHWLTVILQCLNKDIGIYSSVFSCCFAFIYLKDFARIYRYLPAKFSQGVGDIS
jgi:hypothetical protein